MTLRVESPDSTRYITKKDYKLLTKADAKQRRMQDPSLSKKEAKKQAEKEYAFFQIMPKAEEKRRREELYNELVQTTQYSNPLNLSEEDLRRLARTRDVSDVPTHMKNTAKHILHGKKLRLF